MGRVVVQMKDILTESELRFLDRYRLGPEDVYDGRFIRKYIWQNAAKREGKTLVLGSPCRKLGHRLRTRAGHCVQCNPKNLKFEERFSTKQCVYIAGSLEARLIKVGTCKDIEQREGQMRYERYGDAGDWECLLFLIVDNAGQVEDKVQKRLSQFAVARPYWKDGVQQMATELYTCSFSQAQQTLMDVLGDEALGAWRYRRTYLYEFD